LKIPFGTGLNDAVRANGEDSESRRKKKLASKL
jgi:hypothetical protein